mgnify:FL=1
MAALTLVFAFSVSAADKKKTAAPYDFEAEYAEYQAFVEETKKTAKDDKD